MNAPLLAMLGQQELILIFLAVLLLFGAKKLPELARGMGRSMGEFKKAKNEFEEEITRAQDDLDDKKAKPVRTRTHGDDEHLS